MLNARNYVEDDAAANLLERRWFGAQTAAQALEADCEVLLRVLKLAEADFRRMQVRLREFEHLRDALGEELAKLDDVEVPRLPDGSPGAP